MIRIRVVLRSSAFVVNSDRRKTMLVRHKSSPGNNKQTWSRRLRSYWSVKCKFSNEKREGETTIAHVLIESMSL